MSDKIYIYESLKNRFIIFKQDIINLSKSNINKYCDKYSAHGIMIYDIKYNSNNNQYDINAEIINSDGSNGGFSGNGLRCLAEHIFNNYKTYFDNKLLIKISDNIYQVRKIKNKILCEFALSKEVCLYKNFFYIDVGNPHLLYESSENNLDFIKFINNKVIQDPDYAKFNISKYNNSPNNLPDNLYELFTFERGVGPTPACSSAALALCVLLKKKYNYKLDDLIIKMPGGDLNIKFIQDNKVIFSAPVFQVESELDYLPIS